MGFDAEYSYVPESISTREDFYEHVLANVKALLDDGSDQKVNWVTALASVSSVLYNSYADFPQFGQSARVNWAGFYVIPALVAPAPVGRQEDRLSLPNHLALGPYHGRPGCLRIPLSLKRKGVCANAFLTRKTIVVQDVHEVPGHIACDGTTESEVVVPIVIDFATVEGKSRSIPIGVLDLDCQKADVWTSGDQTGLESIVRWLAGKDGPVNWQSALGAVESAV